MARSSLERSVKGARLAYDSLTPITPAPKLPQVYRCTWTVNTVEIIVSGQGRILGEDGANTVYRQRPG